VARDLISEYSELQKEPEESRDLISEFNKSNLPEEAKEDVRAESTPKSFQEKYAEDIGSELKSGMLPFVGSPVPGLSGIGQSVVSGVASDIQNLYNLGARTLGKEQIKIPMGDTSQARYPTIADISATLAPLAIPVGGEVGAVVKGAEALARTGSPLANLAIRATGRAVSRIPQGAAAGVIQEAATKENATPEDLMSAAKLGATLNVATKGLIDAVPGAYRSLVNMYKNASQKTGGTIRTPEQANITLKALGDDVLSFPDLVKAPKLQSIYHNVGKYIPFSGVAKKQLDALGRLETDAGKVYSDLKIPTEIDPALARKNIQNDIKNHVDIVSKEFEPKFDEINSERLIFDNSNSKYYAKQLLNKDKESIDIGAGGILEQSMRNKLQLLGKESEIDELLNKYPEKIREQIASKIDVLPKETSIGTVRDSIRKYKELASELGDAGNLNEARIYSGLAKQMETDLENSLAKEGDKNIFNKYKNLNKEYNEKIVPFKHPEKIGLKKLIDDRVNLTGTELEKIVSDTTNESAIKQLPQEAKNKIFSRLLMNNVNEKLDSRAEKIIDSYNTMAEHEKNLLSPELKKEFDNLSSRVDQLRPVINSSKSKIWKVFHGMKNIGYLLGIPASHMLHATSPMASALVPMAGAARFLGSKKLIDAYVTGNVPYETLPSSLGLPLSRLGTQQLSPSEESK